MKISKNHVKSVVERVGSPLDSVKKTSATQPPSTSKRTNRQPIQPEAHLKGVSAQIRLVDSEVHPETPPFCPPGGMGEGWCFFVAPKKDENCLPFWRMLFGSRKWTKNLGKKKKKFI